MGSSRKEQYYDIEQFVPSLKEAVKDIKLDCSKILKVAIQTAVSDKKTADSATPIPDVSNRSVMFLLSGETAFCWRAESLASLFRGDKVPLAIGDYPEVYLHEFALLEVHVLELSDLLGEPKDGEMREIYSYLRRRPDGKSLGVIHDFMWRSAAVLLGTHPLSKAEFEAILSRLERSCRTFETHPSSRNYVAALRQTFEKD